MAPHHRVQMGMLVADGPMPVSLAPVGDRSQCANVAVLCRYLPHRVPAGNKRAGSQSVLNRLSELMFVEVIRLHMNQLANNNTGWLAGLRDPLVGRALTLLHARPSYDWTLEELASEAAASRSALADRFTHLVGCPPIQYLTQWRMQIAAKRWLMTPGPGLPLWLMTSATNPKLHSAELSKSLSADRRVNGETAARDSQRSWTKFVFCNAACAWR